MRRNQAQPRHDEAVARRLATLSAELSAVRAGGDGATRVRDESRPRAGVVAAPPPEAPSPVEIPVPGRHAARPTRRPWADRLGVDRLGLRRVGPWHVAAVMTLVAVAVVVAALLAVRAQPEPLPVGASEAVEPLTAVSTQTAAPAGATPDSDGDVTVDVAGKVRSPGIAVLPSGARVVDAIEAAGGARRGVDLSSLNLARVLVDGEQVLVGQAAPAGVAGQAAVPGAPAPGALVNINTADQVTLETLPGVGPVTAGAIISWRTTNGTFTAVDQLVEVDGIGEATLAKLAPLVTI
jgi:competence protein ComEA